MVRMTGVRIMRLEAVGETRVGDEVMDRVGHGKLGVLLEDRGNRRYLEVDRELPLHRGQRTTPLRVHPCQLVL